MNLFHIHRWSKWEKVKVERVTIWSSPNRFPSDMQERRCETCGRFQRAEVDW